MGTLLPLVTALIAQAPNVVSLILNLVHPDGSTTVMVLAQADANDTAAQNAIAQLNAAIAAKKKPAS